MDAAPRILLTGATGYVGGRLLRRLEAHGFRVRCLARRPEFLHARVAPTTEVVAGDLLDRPTLQGALAGIETAYYLTHALGRADGFEEAERRAAINFGAAARVAGVRHIIYLGGLANPHDDLSPHLRARLDTGTRLRDSGVPVTEFRASIIIGSGSLSFEMIGALVERLPVMITPTWVRLPAQPIAIEDVLRYLEAALGRHTGAHEVFEIGGPDVWSYGDLMREYARQRGLRRWLIPVPVLTPWVSSLWLGLVTPIFARVGRRLVESIRHSTVVRSTTASETFGVRPLPLREAMARAIASGAETRWSDALSSASGPRPWGGIRVGNTLIDSRSVHTLASPEATFRPVRQIGGRRGWPYATFLWRVRGWLDLIVGGVGMRRGRRDGERVRPGDVIDCWRVVDYQEPSRLRLEAEMRMPGRAWLEFRVAPDATGSTITQTASFEPRGLSGLVYWFSIWPLHQLIFQGMLRNLVREAEDQSG